MSETELKIRKFKHCSWIAIVSQGTLLRMGFSHEETKGLVLDEKGKIREIALNIEHQQDGSIILRRKPNITPVQSPVKEGPAALFG